MSPRWRPLACRAWLGDSSWSRRNGSLGLPDKPDTLVMAILLHIDGSLVLASFSDVETACLHRCDDLPGFPRVFLPTLHSHVPHTTEGASAGRLDAPSDDRD
jgi:hypothetical protein